MLIGGGYGIATHDFNSKLKEDSGDVENVQSRHRVVRFLIATGLAERIESWVKKLDQHIAESVVSVH